MHNRERPLEHDVNWAMLPQVCWTRPATGCRRARKSPQPLVDRGTNVYGTLFQEDYFKLLETMLRLEQTTPDKLPLPMRLRKETVERWREENEAHKVELTRTIQQELGYGWCRSSAARRARTSSCPETSRRRHRIARRRCWTHTWPPT